MSRPFCPSTSLISVWAATTPSSPGLYGTVIGTQVYAAPEARKGAGPLGFSVAVVVVPGVLVRLHAGVHVDVQARLGDCVRHLVLHALGDRVRLPQRQVRF